MESGNKLAGDITRIGENAQYDAACKQLLSNKIILAWILKSCVEEFRTCDVKDIAEKYIEGTPQVGVVGVRPDETNTDVASGSNIHGMSNEDKLLTEGKVTYDIRFFAVAPGSGEFIRLLLNIEAQGDYYPGYPLIKRGIYYGSRMISAQYGTEFEEAHYEHIKKVYSIWICMNPPKMNRNCIARYAIRKEDIVGHLMEEWCNYDLMTVLMICIGTPQDGNYEGILKLLEVLLSNRIKAEEKKRILNRDFGIEMTYKMEREVQGVCNLSELIERKGIEQGLEQGMEQGTMEANLATLKSLMKKMHWTAEEALQAMGIAESEWEKYRSLI